MRARGITYDTGVFPGADLTRPRFDAADVRRDLAAVAGELHCTAVRITGREPERIDAAARIAAAAGLEVWWSPFPVDVPPEGLVALYAECAERAEELRRAGAEVVFVAGCETTVFCPGFLPGTAGGADGYRDRLRALVTADQAWWAALGPAQQRFNEALAEIAAAVRGRFGGPVTYAAGPWEGVDWGPFDIVSIDAYRDASNAGEYAERLGEFAVHGKPVAVTEFGTCAYRGAGGRGGMAWAVPEDAVPDEGEQVRYFEELADVFEAAGVDAAFWFSFADFGKAGARDLGAYGAVRMLDASRWEPKQVFAAIGARYGAASAGG